jgi:putative ABC transport system permease protein
MGNLIILPMLLLETIRVALGALRQNLMRSVLTMLGIVIGVGAVIAMDALGNGAKASIQERISKLGTNLLQIDAARVAQGGVAISGVVRLTEKDAKFLQANSTKLAEILPQQDRDLQVVWQNHNVRAQITGAAANFLVVRRYELDAGRFFTSSEDVARKKLAVLGADAVTNLGFTSPEATLGTYVRIGGQQFLVIGVLKAKGSTGGFGEPDGQVVIPFETGRFRLFGTPYINDLFVTASREDSVPETIAETEVLLRKAHRIRPEKPSDFRIRSSEEFLNTLSETTQTFTLLLAGIAAVSLLVGGIGIMNIMLVSVTERTREIGIRKALGATSRGILVQFLAEAVVLCVLGGMMGAAVGVGAAVVFKQTMGWNTSAGIDMVLLAVLFSASIGIVFGVWPAMRAAALDPIEALRYE